MLHAQQVVARREYDIICEAGIQCYYQPGMSCENLITTSTFDTRTVGTITSVSITGDLTVHFPHVSSVIKKALPARPGSVDQGRGVLTRIFPALMDVTEEEVEETLKEFRRKNPS